MLIARASTAQDDVTGDGTTTTVLLVGEILAQGIRYISEGTHPTVLVEGLHLARTEAKNFLEKYKAQMTDKVKLDRETLVSVAKTSLRTKVHEEMASKLADIVVDSVNTVKDGNNIDLYMVELMHMEHKTDIETTFVKGLVLDHGARHPDMKKVAENCYILTCNVSLEYEKSEVNSSFNYTSAEQRQKMVEAERKVVDEKVKKIIELKNEVCKDDPSKNFVVINQKGIDPMSLDMLFRAGIIGIRRAKRRNMERLTLACGGVAVNSVDDLTPDVLGWAGKVHQHNLGEEIYTFVEDVKTPKSCTILIRGPNQYTIAQIKDAIHDGLRAVKNVYDDGCVVPGAGSFEVALSEYLQQYAKKVEGKSQLGVKLFADSLLIIPKTLAQNSGFDAQEKIIALQQANSKGSNAGLDVYSGEVIDPIQLGILDNYKVKVQTVEAAVFVSSQLLYVDEILRAGRANKPQQSEEEDNGME